MRKLSHLMALGMMMGALDAPDNRRSVYAPQDVILIGDDTDNPAPPQYQPKIRIKTNSRKQEYKRHGGNQRQKRKWAAQVRG